LKASSSERDQARWDGETTRARPLPAAQRAGNGHSVNPVGSTGISGSACISGIPREAVGP